MLTKSISDDDLRKAATDVAYEFKMFRQACKRYFSPVPPTFVEPPPGLGHNDSTINMPLTLQANAAPLSAQCVSPLDRDAFLIHFRVLMDFFYQKEEKDDIRAHHYTCETPESLPHGPMSLKGNVICSLHI